MAAPVIQALLTAEEYAETEDPPGMVSELVRGRIVLMPPAKTGHGRRADRISKRLDPFIQQHKLGEMTGEGGYVLARNPDTVRAPDAGFVAAHRIPPGGISDDEYFEGPPDLAIEVISPGDRDRDVADKVRDWLDAGAGRVWEVRPRTGTVTIHRIDAPPVTRAIGTTLTSDDAGFLVGGLALPVAELFG